MDELIITKHAKYLERIREKVDKILKDIEAAHSRSLFAACKRIDITGEKNETNNSSLRQRSLFKCSEVFNWSERERMINLDEVKESLKHVMHTLDKIQEMMNQFDHWNNVMTGNFCKDDSATDYTMFKQSNHKVETKNLDSAADLPREIDMASNNETRFQPTDRNQGIEVRKHIIRDFFNPYCSSECEIENLDGSNVEPDIDGADEEQSFSSKDLYNDVKTDVNRCKHYNEGTPLLVEYLGSPRAACLQQTPDCKIHIEKYDATLDKCSLLGSPKVSSDIATLIRALVLGNFTVNRKKSRDSRLLSKINPRHYKLSESHKDDINENNPNRITTKFCNLEYERSQPNVWVKRNVSMIGHIKGRGKVSLKSKERNETFNARKPKDSHPKRSASLTLSGLELYFLPSSYSDLVRHLAEIIPNEKARN